MKRLSCAFTGHRPQKLPWRYDENSEGCMQLKDVLTSQIVRLVKNGMTDFLSGIALGTDIICSELILSQHEKNPALRLHCILPCVEQDVKWSASARERYRSVLKQADSIVYVNRSYQKTCMLERDRFLVECSDYLLAVYNGELQGGTAATVRYAKNLGRKIILIDPITWRTTYVGISSEPVQ